jgi:hypothetical protein
VEARQRKRWQDWIRERTVKGKRVQRTDKIDDGGTKKRYMDENGSFNSNYVPISGVEGGLTVEV